MKIDIKNIELIHKYLDKFITQDEIETFENQLQLDLEFQNFYKEQLALIQGVKRAGLKEEIRTAKQSYYKFKWLKILGVSLSFVVILFLVWVTFFRTPQIEDSRPIIESKTVVFSDKDSVEEIDKRDIIVNTDSFVVGVDATINSLKEKTRITPEELKDEIGIVKVEESEKLLEFISMPLDSALFEKKQQYVIIKTEKEFSDILKEGSTLNIAEIALIDSIIGTYELKLEAINSLIIDKLTLNPNGTFEFHEYDNHEKGIPRERNKYGKGTWKVDKKILLFTTSKSDFDKKYTLDFNKTKARFITKSTRDKSKRDIKTSIQFYESALFWIPKRTLLKTE